MVTGANIFELMEADWATAAGTSYETSLVILILTLLTGIVVNMLMVWGIHAIFCWLLIPWLVYYVPIIIAYFAAPAFSIRRGDCQSIVIVSSR